MARYRNTRHRTKAGLDGWPAARALSVAGLALGLLLSGVGLAYVAAAGRLGWQSPEMVHACANILNPSCGAIAGPVTRDIHGALTAAVAGAALLLARRLAIRHGGLAAVGRGFTLVISLTLGLVAFASGMGDSIPAPPAGSLSWIPVLLPGNSWLVGAAGDVVPERRSRSHSWHPRPVVALLSSCLGDDRERPG